GDLHFRRHLRHLGRGVSLRGVARQAAHPHVLAARLGAFPRTGRPSGPRPTRRPGGALPLWPDVYPTSLADALVDAPVDLLGVPAGRGDHFPLGLWVDSVPQPALRPDAVRHLRLWLPRAHLPLAHALCRDALPCPGYLGRSGAGRNLPFAGPPHARPGSPGAAVLRHGFLPTYTTLRHLYHRARPDGLA